MLRVENASFHYDDAKESGFTNVSFSLKRGDVLCVLGPNGCGKTTLLKSLMGILELENGSISLEDKNITHMQRNDIAKLVGYVPQLHQPVFPFSVMDAVLVGRAPHLKFLESPGREDEEIADMAIEALGLKELRNRPYTQLSGGERQLVVFARVMAQQPSLLLLDEPTSHLDFGNQIRVLRLVERLAQTGLPIIMASHFPDHAFLISSKVAIMRKGEFIGFGSPDEVITEENMEKAYGIKVRVMSVDGAFGRRICLPLKGELAANPSNGMLEKLYATRF